LAVALTACSAGQLAQTANVKASVDGASGDVGGMALRTVVIAYPDGGKYPKGVDARLEFVMVNTTDHDDALVEVRTDAAERVTLATRPAATGSAIPSGSESATPTPSPSPSPSPSSTPSPTPTGSGTGSGTATPTGSPSPPVSSSAPPPTSPTPSPTPEPPGRIEVPAQSLVACRDGGPAVTLVGLTRELRAAELVQVTFVFEQAGELTLTVPVAVPTSELPPPPTIDVQGTEGG